MLGVYGKLQLDHASFIIIYNLADSLVVLHDKPSVLSVWLEEFCDFALPPAVWHFSIHQVNVDSIHHLGSRIDRTEGSHIDSLAPSIISWLGFGRS